MHRDHVLPGTGTIFPPTPRGEFLSFVNSKHKLEHKGAICDQDRLRHEIRENQQLHSNRHGAAPVIAARPHQSYPRLRSVAQYHLWRLK